ncbi:hypothetical protein BD410DRAFT_313356 [Rickenella mellea]|uniref:HNH nuclease domain-containing protein n=1 Tax=Rickenella mellea TaxID=50990 RepID=A0A4Y7PEY2_9AGAM|nr:hypothetical protein BD410DRAFT_313356 [Rickenella mellea]
MVEQISYGDPHSPSQAEMLPGVTPSSASFQRRLLERDQTCAICTACGHPEPIVPSSIHGVHIIPAKHRQFWDSRGLSRTITDQSVLGSDDLMSSCDNGIVLCQRHEHDLANFYISIHPETHVIVSFQPPTAELHGLKITTPWDCQNPLLPPPNKDVLHLHFVSCISRWIGRHAYAREPDSDSLSSGSDIESDE